ncbi:hypothetical protein [Novosphingobium malaysiense]|uniref:hypothetical protein n=1 Tax=Novosphingobium malaysiense TaxID=1348853 RepID=UPI00068B0056|nr:hypothetical protein [Novosphingobium malaysiense]
MKKILLILALAGFSSVGLAQTANDQGASPQPSPLVVAPAAPSPAAVLPANTQVSLSMNETVTTKGKRWNEGDNFDMTVTHDVRLGNYVIIPRGSRGVGRITYLTNKGAFGKSGKMEIDIEYVDVHGQRIPLSGHYRQEGEGNTVGTVAGVVAVGVFAGFVTGHSGVIPQGRELTAYTKQDLPVAFSGPAPAAPQQFVVGTPRPQSVTPASSSSAEPGTAAPAGAANDLTDGNKVGAVRCVTCN